MTVALILLVVIILAGALLYGEHRLWLRRHSSQQSGTDAPAAVADNEEEECCGMHVTCEKDSLLASVSKEIEYYDDEELDRFAGRRPDEYSDDEIEEFRDILLTTRAEDIAGWARSLQLRGVALPAPVRDELIMIVAEAWQSKTHATVS